ncbi:MAG: lamin tail domain-containing protein [Prevotellaceae bacterium]|nr:lamin tail domain-containing protein [Prevotellaceae bacterium]
MKTYFIRLFTFTLTLLLSVATLSAAESWIDVTTGHIKSYAFNSNSAAGWLGTPFTFNSSTNNAQHRQLNYLTYQDITGLVPGKYRLSVQAFYRAGTSSNDYTHSTKDGDAYRYASIFAETNGSKSVAKLPYLTSGGYSSSLGGTSVKLSNGKYVPDNAEAASAWFTAGYYNTSVEFNVGEDGTLRIGLEKQKMLAGDWTCADNWKLEYWGEDTKAESVALSFAERTIYIGEKCPISASVLPSNAANQSVKWTSSSKAVATVDEDGVIVAVGKGTTTIKATANDGSKKTASCQVTVAENAPTADNLVINEVQTSNIDTYIDPSWNYGQWIELYNPTDVPVSLAGLYISDDAENLKKYQFTQSHGVVEPHGFKTIWFDHYDKYCLTQVDFTLEYEGSTIIISNGVDIITKLTYPEIPARTSYARKTDGGTQWGITGTPTLSASNNESSFASKQIAAPVVDKDGQLFTGSLSVNVEIPEGATLRYTTDGSVPTMRNGMTAETGSFDVSSTSTYRFRLYKDGMLPSDVVTRSYIVNNRNYAFPILSLTVKEGDLYSSEMGVFETGPHGCTGRGRGDKCNWNMSWDRPVNIEYMKKDEDGNYRTVYDQEINFAVSGGWSRSSSPHSFKLKGDKQFYGGNFMSYPFFSAKPYIKNKSLLFRNGGNDQTCRLKDAALQEIVRRSGLYVDCQTWEGLTHIFINGEYYAELNLREPGNKHFAYANYGISSDEIEQFEMDPELGYVQGEGTGEIFNEIYTLSSNAADEETYKKICDILDIDEFTNYMAVELYYASDDWPHNNLKAFCKRDGGKYHIVLVDIDSSFARNSNTFNGFASQQNHDFDGTKQEVKVVTIFLNLLKNETFRRKFIDTYCIVGGSVITPERTKEIVNEMASEMSKNGFVDPSSMASDIISHVNDSYNGTMIDAMKNYSPFGLNVYPKIKLALNSNIANGKLYLNNIWIPTSKFNGYYFAPATLKAEAPAGYKFVGWQNQSATKRTMVFDKASTWKYYDKGTQDGKGWNTVSFDDSAWTSGQAPLGYAKDGLNTTIKFGNSSNNKRPTYYFRKTFNLDSEVSQTATFTLDYIVDDGFIVYVNGTEAGRFNMPSGDVSYSTYASGSSAGNPDTGSMTLSKSLFHKGENLIAVEVHNNSATSTDIEWEGSLAIDDIDTSGANYVSTSKEYKLPSSSATTLTAVFEPLPEGERKAITTPVVINEVSADNEMFINEYFKKSDWIELYNTTDEDIDVAGMYVSDNKDKPTKYCIPEFTDGSVNTIIPARGHLVVWCDKVESISQIHTSFKLGAEGGSVVITAKDGSWSSALDYPEHDGWHTVGRYPDGANKYYVFATPTIGKQNVLGIYDEVHVPLLRGDANGDGRVDVADITITANYILGSPSEDFIYDNANVDADGAITVADITGIATIILENAKLEQEFLFGQ